MICIKDSNKLSPDESPECTAVIPDWTNEKLESAVEKKMFATLTIQRKNNARRKARLLFHRKLCISARIRIQRGKLSQKTTIPQPACIINSHKKWHLHEWHDRVGPGNQYSMQNEQPFQMMPAIVRANGNCPFHLVNELTKPLMITI